MVDMPLFGKLEWRFFNNSGGSGVEAVSDHCSYRILFRRDMYVLTWGWGFEDKDSFCVLRDAFAGAEEIEDEYQTVEDEERWAEEEELEWCQSEGEDA